MIPPRLKLNFHKNKLASLLQNTVLEAARSCPADDPLTPLQRRNRRDKEVFQYTFLIMWIPLHGGVIDLLGLFFCLIEAFKAEQRLAGTCEKDDTADRGVKAMNRLRKDVARGFLKCSLDPSLA